MAIALAEKGLSVALLEKDPNYSVKVLKGEWLHSRGVKVLSELGILPKLPPESFLTQTGYQVSVQGKQSIDLPLPKEKEAMTFCHVACSSNRTTASR